MLCLVLETGSVPKGLETHFRAHFSAKVGWNEII